MQRLKILLMLQILHSHKKISYCCCFSSKIVIPLENLIDFNEEIARQEKKLGKLQNEKNL